MKAIGSAGGNGAFAPGRVGEMLSQQQHVVQQQQQH
jgi:hypothetical protein